MRRVTGLRDALVFFREHRRPEPGTILTDGNGLYEQLLSPIEFARRVAEDVRSDGDEALLRVSSSLDRQPLSAIEVPSAEIDASVANLDREAVGAIERSVQRVHDFQSRAKPSSWFDDGRQYGEMVSALDRVGVYVPGGTAPLASTVIMTIVPARVAGVSEVFLASPAPGDSLPHPAVLAAAKISGVDRVFKIGGSQAIAAFAYGTETVPKVDLVCGPGNIFTTAAKQVVYGEVGVDGLYGPTETMVIVDDSADPEFTAADLLAQAEHDVIAMPVLVATSEDLANRVLDEVERQLSNLPREAIARKAVQDTGVAVVVSSVDEAIEVANAFAPEHLCIMTFDPSSYREKARFAGGLFIGEHSAEVMADYVAGPSHVMPTGGTARYASALSVRTFLRFTPVLQFDDKMFVELARDAEVLARLEGLEGHARAAEFRRRRSVGE